MRASGCISVLLVETNQHVMEICSRIITRFFPEVELHTAASAADAMALVNVYKPDIIVSDVVLPKKTGMQVAREICAENPDTLVIFVTGHPDLDHRAVEPHSRELCLHSIIAKPIDMQELLNALKAAINIVVRREAGGRLEP